MNLQSALSLNSAPADANFVLLHLDYQAPPALVLVALSLMLDTEKFGLEIEELLSFRMSWMKKRMTLPSFEAISASKNIE